MRTNSHLIQILLLFKIKDPSATLRWINLLAADFPGSYLSGTCREGQSGFFCKFTNSPSLCNLTEKEHYSMASLSRLFCVPVMMISFIILVDFADGRCARAKRHSDASRKDMKTVASVEKYVNSIGQGVWCVGKPAAEDIYLRQNIDYACGTEGVDCRFIQEGGDCFLPNTPIAHASFAMNLYYQRHGRNWWNCNFNNTGLVVFTDPSFGKCKYDAEWGI
ncbi:hypothetical protein KP509_08G009300 [Ceratopteris richardii]|uniref:X8 domain-containing protein n=1 Tax=Ceratopteris richardii TaxID=49495 RepID=A0A8T2UDZ9_CERRI|nr:hypothetical protein KP509_08G009300 [Ceratopteris richardii]